MVNLKSASFVLIMLLQEGLSHIHSQKKPGLHFGESFAKTLPNFIPKKSGDTKMQQLVS